VLTEPGLSGILAAVREGRITFQRILTYTLRSIVHKTRQVLFLGIGLIMTGHAILTPMLVVLSMMTGDSGDVLDDRQCTTISAAECVAHR
jgi:H+-transporting ATPase